jgi:hypothetical protein
MELKQNVKSKIHVITLLPAAAVSNPFNFIGLT